MASVIQNLACFEVDVNSKSNTYYFNEDILNGKTINQIFLFSGVSDKAENVFFSPFYLDGKGQKPFTPLIPVFLNLFSPEDKPIVQNYNITNFFKSFDSISDNLDAYTEFSLDRKIDTKKSHFYFQNRYDSPDSNIYKLLVYAVYQTEKIKLKNLNIQGTFSIDVDLSHLTKHADVALSDFVDPSYRNFPIKKIFVNGRLMSMNDKSNKNFISLRSKKNFIENIPISFFQENGFKQFYLDEIKIDFEQSFFKLRDLDNKKTRLTFMY